MTKDFRFVFFGTPDVAVASLEALKASGMTPTLVVTAPDAPVGRGMVMTPSLSAQWAKTHDVPTLKPKKLSDPDVLATLQKENADVFVVVAYGKIIPDDILSLPPKGTLNMHPSLLPRHRGPSPIESQILVEDSPENVGVSIMLLDDQMDHGPILAQETSTLPEWPLPASELRTLLAEHGAQLLTKTLPAYLSGEITPAPQNDNDATFCSIIKKEDAQIDLSGNAKKNYKKILAYNIWPRAYFFAEKHGKRVRVVVTKAHLENNALVIDSVIPEGKKEMSYKDFVR